MTLEDIKDMASLDEAFARVLTSNAVAAHAYLKCPDFGFYTEFDRYKYVVVALARLYDESQAERLREAQNRTGSTISTRRI